MASIPGEIADALVAALQSPSAQAALTTAVEAGEVQIQTLVDNAINNAKGTGILGVFIAAAKGSVEAEVNAEIAAYPAAKLVALITSAAVAEAKALGG
jgi:hypothetical protein